MAITAEQLVFQLTAKVAGFEDEINGAATIFNKAADKIESGFGRMDKRIAESSRANSSNIKAMVATITGALGAREVIQYADAWTKARNALVSAKVPANQQASTLERLFKQSQDYSVELNSQVSLYGQVSRAAAGLTSNGEDIFRFTEAVAAGLKADGKSAGEASGALMQLGQALRSPIIQAEEFNSLIDGAPSLLEAAANGISRFNGNMGALITAAKSGNLASREFFEGVLKGSEELKARVGQSADTFEGAFLRINNALTRYIGQTDESLGASQRLIAGLNAFADDFDNIADTVLKLAAVISGALVGRAIGGALTTIPIAIVSFKLLSLAASGAASAAGFMSANFGGATRSIAAAAAASRAFRLAAFGLVAGPIGAVIGAVATTFVAFSDQIFTAGENSEEASRKADRYADALRRVKGAADDAGEAVEKSGKTFLATENRRLSEQLKGDQQAYEEAAAEVRDAVADALARLEDVKDLYGDDPAYQAQIANLKAIAAGLDGTVDGAVSAQNALNKLATDDPGFQNLANKFDPVLDRIIGISEEIDKATGKLKEFAAASKIDLNGFQSEGGREAQRARSAKDFLDEKMALELRTGKEKEIADLTAKLLKDAKEAGEAITEAEAAASARLTVEKKAAQTSFEGAISGFTGRVVGAESGGDVNAKNPNSTATGLGQFIESTWLSLFKKHFPDEAANLTDPAILALRRNGDKSKALIEAYARENASILQRAGVSVDEVALQLAHFLGPQGAINVLKAAPGTLASSVLSKDAVAANPTILGGGRTVDDVIAYGQKRAGMTTGGTERLDARSNFDQTLKDQKAYIDALKAETGLRASLNPLVDDYGRAISTLQAAQQLFTDAQREGTDAGRELKDVQQLLTGDLSGLSPIARDQALAMRALAEETGKAEAAGNELNFSQNQLKDRLQESSALGKDVLGGFIRDLREGKSATEALGGALEKLADKLLDNALNSLFDGPAAGSGGGLLGGLFSIFTGGGGLKLAGGGRVRGPGGPKGDKIPTWLSDGEHVTRAAMVKKHGPLLDAINADRVPMLAEGSPPLTSLSLPSLPKLGRAGSREVIDIQLQDDSGRMATIARQEIQTASGPLIQLSTKSAVTAVSNNIGKINAAAARKGK
ncbi:tape measure protein [Pararhizobium sp. BT-229]|uniref:tape measure protein n=1 Tax=Pararhizobium sp. BT-229 TaxID=2986923 RepID=UPI0021F74F3C|nr:tape measure protein [Pararhizobium sp. BT-229]MCV9965452.1 tape measure protein [Pararhizobium sp. BT-229]